MAELRLYDVISPFSFDASAAGVQRVRDSARPGEEIHIRVHSPGGDPLEAQAMFAQLQQHNGPVRFTVEGLAASAASFLVALPGATVEMFAGALFMIHHASGGVFGNVEDVESLAALMRRTNALLARTYQARSSLPLEEVQALMAAETWMTAAEAVQRGFADRIVDGDTALAAAARSFSLAAFAHPPSAGDFLTSNPKPCEGNAMEISAELLTRLGLSAGASEADVVAALDARTAPAAPVPAPAPAAPPDISALVATQVRAALAEDRQKREASEAHRDAVNAAVERFIAARKIRPADRDKAIKACGATADQLRATVEYWESAPEIVGGPVQTPAAPGGQITERDRRLAAAAGMSVDDFVRYRDTSYQTQLGGSR